MCYEHRVISVCAHWHVLYEWVRQLPVNILTSNEGNTLYIIKEVFIAEECSESLENSEGGMSPTSCTSSTDHIL